VVLVSAEGPCKVGWLWGGEAQQTGCSEDAFISSRLPVEDDNMSFSAVILPFPSSTTVSSRARAKGTTQDVSQGSEYDEVLF
jgi:hypothetical protein